MKRITRGKALFGKTNINGVDFTLVGKGTTSIGVLPLADAAGTTTTFAVANAAFGDYAFISHTTATISGVTVNAYVTAAGTVGVRIQNETGGTVTLGTATYNYLVVR